jgi:hypothetical protein
VLTSRHSYVGTLIMRGSTMLTLLASYLLFWGKSETRDKIMCSLPTASAVFPVYLESGLSDSFPCPRAPSAQLSFYAVSFFLRSMR